MRGATPHKIDAAVVVPSAFLMWPVKMAMWGQDIYGDLRLRRGSLRQGGRRPADVLFAQ